MLQHIMLKEYNESISMSTRDRYGNEKKNQFIELIGSRTISFKTASEKNFHMCF